MATFATPLASQEAVTHIDPRARMELLQKAVMLGWYQSFPDARMFNPELSNRYTAKYNGACIELAKLDVAPTSEIYIAETTPQSDVFSQKSLASAVCKATGKLAAQRIAEQTHRIATPEEAERYEREDRQRSKLCAEIEANSPENRKMKQNISLSPEVVAALRGQVTQAERPAPASEPTEAKSAAAVLQAKADGRGK